MKKGILAFLVMMLAFAAGHAQDKPQGERFQQRAAQMDEFFEGIGVTDAQMKEIKAARNQMGLALNECRGQGRNEETRKKINSIREDHANRLKSILTEEQFNQWEEHVGNRQMRRHKRKGNKPE